MTTKRIWKYELLPADKSLDEYDARFGVTGVCESLVRVPVDAMLIAIDVQYARAVDVTAAVVAWFVVNPDPAASTELRRFFFAYTGALWPERQHLATVRTYDAGPDARVVHVFYGGAVSK
jgi:hypothetical protein